MLGSVRVGEIPKQVKSMKERDGKTGRKKDRNTENQRES